MMDLASNLFGQQTARAASPSKPEKVVDLVIHGLPENANAQDLRRLASVKHVVDATVEEDSIKNVCTGAGKLRVRLNEGEDIEHIKNELAKVGLDV
jgi:hypothetical protein